MKKAIQILLIVQLAFGILILIGQYYFVTDECSCGLISIADVLFPILWILSIIIIIFSIIKKNWDSLLFAILITIVTYIGKICISDEFNKTRQQKKYSNEIIAHYKNVYSASDGHYSNYNDIFINLYKDHYRIIEQFGPDCGCRYLGKYRRSNDTIYLDNNIARDDLKIFTNKILIEKKDTLRPIGQNDYIFVKVKY